MSPGETLLQFTHQGTITTTTNSIILQPLTPQSSYIIKVSAITARGQGEEVTVVANTDEVESNYGNNVANL